MATKSKVCIVGSITEKVCQSLLRKIKYLYDLVVGKDLLNKDLKSRKQMVIIIKEKFQFSSAQSLSHV